MLTSVVPSCRSSKIHLRSSCSSSSESSPVARPVPQRWPPELRRITTCSHHHVVTPSGAGWLLMSIPGRSMCSPLLLISKGSPLPRGAAVDSRLMALPPPPSPHTPAFAIQCIHPPPVSRRSMKEGEELEADLSKGPQLHSEGVRLFRSPEKKVPLSSGRCVGVISCPCSSLASHLYVSTSSRGVTLDKAPLPSIIYVQCRRVSLLDSASPRISFALVR